LLCALSLYALLVAATQAADTPEEPARLLDRAPFDRLTLNAANQGTVIDVLPLDLPGRRVPHPLPTEGSLTLRRVAESSLEYSVSWNSIARIELYEQLLLAEAKTHMETEEMGAAFDLLSFLLRNYPELQGLREATDHYLQRDALRESQAGRYDEAFVIFQALHDRNPKYPGLAGAVESVGDRLIRKHLAKKRYYAARKVLELMEQAYPGLDLPSVSTWKQRFRKASERQLQIARGALDRKQYEAARAALHQAAEIFPNLPGVRPLVARLERENPEIVVGVARHGPAQTGRRAPGSTLPGGQPQEASGRDIQGPLADWAAIRVAPLVDPPLIERIGFGAEGGVYRSPWADLEIDESGLKFTLRLTPDALRLGATAGGLARGLLALADSASPHYLEDYASRFQDISLLQGRTVEIRWRRVPVRPEALVRCSARSVPSLEQSLTYYHRENEQEPGVVRFQRRGAWDLLRAGRKKPPAGSRGIDRPLAIVERRFREEDDAVQALLRGEVDLLDRVPPWQLERLRAHDQVVTGSYRLPTLHVLLFNPHHRLLDQREFRRALCYGIDRVGLVRDILLAGQANADFQPVSGPFPAGKSRHDPVGYAYNQQLTARPYEPRLAAVLAEVARAAEAKVAGEGPDPNGERELPGETQPLVLMFPPEPVARVVCQSIKIQLELVGIPIELRELPDGSQDANGDGGVTDNDSWGTDDYDLLYTELAMWEPVVDARRLLGPGGEAGRCSPSMSLTLDKLDRAQSWKQAQAHLRQVHRIAFYDLPVIPLWQAYNYFAYRKVLHGFGEAPISFYQQVDRWYKAQGELEP
jgi:tetratricopeptide (TPR) repeat protein